MARANVYDCLKSFLLHAKKAKESKLKMLQSDGGGELTGYQFIWYLKRGGITQPTSCAYTPQQNGLAERMNCRLLDMTGPFLKEHNTSKTFWPVAVVIAAYIKIRVTCRGSIRFDPVWSLVQNQIRCISSANLWTWMFTYSKRSFKKAWRQGSVSNYDWLRYHTKSK